ncbi:Thymidylate kinase [Halomicronema hongdechloris C2206]|uniref:Thymidylate kinase n=1 Tax=Halomicronema hongdechloris C2206 TaxID=1641165 RepID=A0A1Z3HNV4_9CYAN|nr:dTMP kinase [Halomicronema hongdechloris]ASC71989.1 Thymidylate kinase [Halomicronema hongdechloris C2206]
MQGKLIVLEGIEGCGKTTQLGYLHRWLRTQPLIQALRGQGQIGDIIITREPGGTPLGGELRQLLLTQTTTTAIAARTELLLYAADRAQHVEEVLSPALARGCLILCDRYVDSTVAYQGYGRGIDLTLIEQLNQIATGGLVPDLTLWLQLGATTGLARSRQRGSIDRMEQADVAFHQRVQQGFEALAAAHPQRIVPVAAAAPVTEVTQQIQTIVMQRLQRWYRPLSPVS